MKNLKKLIVKIRLEIFLFIVYIIFRLPALGSDIINTDATNWKNRIYRFSSALFSGNFKETAIIKYIIYLQK